VERIKTAVLCVLVALSLALTGWLMLGLEGTPQRPQQTFRLERFEKPEVDLRKVLMPVRVVIHFGGNSHTVLLPGSAGYAGLWDEGLIVRGAFYEVSGRPKEVPLDLKQLRSEAGSIEMLMPARLMFSQWITVWTGYPLAEGPDFEADRFLILTGRNPAVIAWAGAQPSGGEGKGYRFDLKGSSKDFADLIRETREIQKESPRFVEAPAEVNGIPVDRGVLLPAEPVSLPPLAAAREVLPEDQIIQRFFIDRFLVRRIEEKDGAVIYSDGRRGLRLYPSGGIEYSCPSTTQSDSAGEDYLSLLERALSFVASHAGVPAEVFPMGPRAGASVSFGYRIRGIPVVGAEPAIAVCLDSQGVEMYQRCVRIPAVATGPARVLVSAGEALDIVARHWPSVFPGSTARGIKDVYIAYWSLPLAEKQDAFKPVWVIESDGGGRAFVDCRSGAVWGEGKADTGQWTGQGQKPR